MLDLFVNHIVEDYPAIDYIAIKTKKGEEISLNWEESEYSWNDDQSVSGRLLKKQIPKDVHAELRKEDVGFWLRQMVFHFSDTDEYYHLPITHDYKLILE